jgi:acetyltransferase
MDAIDRIVTIRPIELADRAGLEELYLGLSPDSRRLRFHALGAISDAEAAVFCSPDHRHREGFIAVIGGRAGHGPRIVGHLCLEPDDAGGAEVGIAVADDVQRHGIGRRLMLAGLDWARREGVDHLTATMLADNGPIHRLLCGLGLPNHIRPLGLSLSEITIDVIPEEVAVVARTPAIQPAA